MNTMRISQLAERCGVPATTLRFYESTGLLPADRTEAGYRVYGQDAVERLAFIGAAKHLGLPLEEVGELLRVWEAGSCAEVRADLRPRIAARLAEAERRAVELNAFTTSLHAATERLDALPDRSDPCDPACGFLARSPGENAAAPAGGAAAAAGERWRGTPVACALSGEGMGERAAQWREVIGPATQRTEITEGLRLTLPAERAGAVATLAAAEQRCCPFFDFRIHLDGPAIHLEVRAPADGAVLLRDLFGPAA